MTKETTKEAAEAASYVLNDKWAESARNRLADLGAHFDSVTLSDAATMLDRFIQHAKTAAASALAQREDSND